MEVHLVETFQEAETFMSWLGERRPILAMDTETGGLDWWKDELRLVQFGDSECGWAIPFHLWGGLALDAIRTYDGPITFHNAKFDVRYLNTNGAELSYGKVHDTRVMAVLLEPDKRSGLKDLGVRLLGADADEWESALNKAKAQGKWNWATVPTTLPEYWQYACMDTILTARLYELLNPRITGRLREVYELEIAVENIIDDMERRGIHIDIPYCKYQFESMTDASQALSAWCEKEYGFGVGSNAKVAAQLQKDGVLLTKMTPGGGWSVDESVLKTIDHPLAIAVIKSRKANRYASAYFGNYITMSDEGFLHPDVNILGARTGRMSISRPALQQIPRDALLRNAFIPRDGNALVSVDYDQIEMRLFTHFCKDPGLIAAFQEGDFFLNAASLIHHTPITDKKDPRRQLTKNASYAKIYGAGPNKFAETAEVPIEDATMFLMEYDAAFPGVHTFQQAIINLAKGRIIEEGSAFVNTPLGRREPANEDDLYKLVNYLVQGTAADVFKQSLVQLDRMGLTENFVLPVHDELVFDVPLSEAEEFGRTVKAAMERTDFTVPLTCGMDILERWGNKYEYE